MTRRAAVRVRKAATSVLGTAVRHSQRCFLGSGPSARKEEVSAFSEPGAKAGL